MIVVSDTTPIISLLKIDRLDLLQSNFGEVLIPKAVYEELTQDDQFENEAKLIIRCPYVKIAQITNYDSVKSLQSRTGLDLGESEAIILADERNADLILMDEAAGRRIAKQLGKNLMGLIGLLIVSYERKIIDSDEIRMAAETLRQNNRRISERHFELLMERTQN